MGTQTLRPVRVDSVHRSGETLRLTSLHIPSDHRWVWCRPCNRSVPKTQLEYRSLLYGMPIQKVLPATEDGNFPIVSGPVHMRKTCHKGLRNFGPPVGRQLASLPSTGELWAVNWRILAANWPPTGNATAAVQGAPGARCRLPPVAPEDRPPGGRGAEGGESAGIPPVGGPAAPRYIYR